MIVNIPSDYDKNTKLTIIRNVDGDVCLKIYGSGEMRLATSGYKMSPDKQRAIINKFYEIINIMKED